MIALWNNYSNFTDEEMDFPLESLTKFSRVTHYLFEDQEFELMSEILALVSFNIVLENSKNF